MFSYTIELIIVFSYILFMYYIFILISNNPPEYNRFSLENK